MKVTVAAAQMSCSDREDENLEKAERLVREAAERGANVIVLQELFSTQFFGMQDWDPERFALASTADESTPVRYLSRLAAELGLVIPASFFERAGQVFFNTVAVIDASGATLGLYRKSHMPVGPPGCVEKYFTSPGDTGFRVWDTQFGKVGIGICWDQWFPEAARCMALIGAELLLFPTAIGSECHDHWEAVMRGHAGANLMPVVAANRIGTESGRLGTTSFWGRSFIADETGAVVAKASSGREEIITASFDLAAIAKRRADWGVFRDRRPDLYGPIMTLDGGTREG